MASIATLIARAGSSPAAVLTAPSAPLNVTGGGATATSITVSWTPPVNDGGAAITRYGLRMSADGGLTWPAPYAYTPVATPAATTFTWTGLTTGTSYMFQVIAQNSVGYGAWSVRSAAVSTAP